MYVPKNGFRTFKPKKPGEPDYDMKAAAARMGAESAPIIPTTNTRVKMNVQNVPNPKYNVTMGQDATQPPVAPTPVPSAKDRAKQNMRDKAAAATAEVKAQRDAPVNAAVDAAKGALQQNQADMMARMGAAGFGTSGAAINLSGNMQARAARELANEINDIRLKQNADARAERGLNHQIEVANRGFEKEVSEEMAAQDAATIAAGGFVDRNNDGFQDYQPEGKNITEAQWNAYWDLTHGPADRQHYGDLDWGAGIAAMDDKNGSVNNPFLLYKDEDPRLAGLIPVSGPGKRGMKMWYDPQTRIYYMEDPR